MTVPDEAGTRGTLRAIALSAYGPTLLGSTGTGAIAPIIAVSARELGASVGIAALLVAALGVGTLLGDLPSAEGELEFVDVAQLRVGRIERKPAEIVKGQAERLTVHDVSPMEEPIRPADQRPRRAVRYVSESRS